MPHRRGGGGSDGLTDADYRVLQLDYYMNNPKSDALPFEYYLKEIKHEQEIREAVRSNGHKFPRSDPHRNSDLPGHDHHSHGSRSVRPHVSTRVGAYPKHNTPSARGMEDQHRTSDLPGHDHHSHGSRSARPHVSPRVGAYPKHNNPSARGMEDQHGMAGRAFEEQVEEPLLPRQRGDPRGTDTHDRDGIFEDRQPSGRFGGHRESGRHTRQKEGLHEDLMAEDLGGMGLGDRGHHGQRNGPHEFGSRNGPPGDTYDESQYTSRGSRRGIREPPNREELDGLLAEDLGGMSLGDRGHHGRRSGPHEFGSRNGPPGDTYEESQYTSRGSRRGVREPPNREELPPLRGHHGSSSESRGVGGRSVREADLQPPGNRRAAPAPLSSRHRTASSRPPQHHHTQGERHHTPHGDSSQHPGFQGSQGARGGREYGRR